MKLENGVYRVGKPSSNDRVKSLENNSPEAKQISELFPNSKNILVGVSNIDGHVQVCKVELNQPKSVDCKVIQPD